MTDSTLDGCVVHHCVLLDCTPEDCVLLGSELDGRRPGEDVLDVCGSDDCTVNKDVLEASVLDACVLE